MLDAMKKLQIHIASLEHVLLCSQNVLVPTHMNGFHHLCTKVQRVVQLPQSTYCLPPQFLLSGNNFEKVKQLMEFTGVQIIPSSTFHLYQRVYMCPGIEELFRDARKATLEEQLSNSLPLVLSGALKTVHHVAITILQSA